MSDDKELYDRWLDLLGEYRRRFGHPAMSPAGGGVTDLSIADGIKALREALERDEPFSGLDISDLPRYLLGSPDGRGSGRQARHDLLPLS